MNQIDFTKAKIDEEERSLLIGMKEECYIKYIYDKYYIEKHLSMDKIGNIFGYRAQYYSRAFKKYNLSARSDM